MRFFLSILILHRDGKMLVDPILPTVRTCELYLNTSPIPIILRFSLGHENDSFNCPKWFVQSVRVQYGGRAYMFHYNNWIYKNEAVPPTVKKVNQDDIPPHPDPDQNTPSGMAVLNNLFRIINEIHFLCVICLIVFCRFTNLKKQLLYVLWNSKCEVHLQYSFFNCFGSILFATGVAYMYVTI